MTTIDVSAAAWHVRKRIARAAFAALLVAGIAGCSTSGPGILQSSTTTPVAQAPAAPQRQQTAQRGKIVIAPVIGAPDNVAKQITAQLGQAVQQRGVSVAQSAAEGADYTLRGYIVAARETTGTKVSYIWDITNPAGHRVHRIAGEELIKGAGAGDPWASVSSQVIQTVAMKTATSLTAWMPAQRATPTSQTPVASATPTTSPVRTAAVPQTSGTTPPPSNTRVAAVTTPSSLTAVVPKVKGAPGDGSVSLARALQKELSRNGVALTNAATPSTYRVEGTVSMGPGNAGKQPIQIEWVVKDPAGQKLGTVSQKNEIPAGSLNGSWGSTADAAAAAATQGILRLLPKTKGT